METFRTSRMSRTSIAKGLHTQVIAGTAVAEIVETAETAVGGADAEEGAAGVADEADVTVAVVVVVDGMAEAMGDTAVADDTRE